MIIPKFHAELSDGRWNKFTIDFQLANLGAEVGRCIQEKNRGITYDRSFAFERMLELLDLTIEDPKNKTRLSELCKLREVLCDFFAGDNEYGSSADWLDKYFLDFGVAAQGERRKIT